MNVEFEWDKQKAGGNLKKHKISFETAIHVFEDPYAISEQDRFENGEYRWQTTGMVDGRLILLVAHTIQYGIDSEIIRIISARPATSTERRKYERNRQI